MHIINCCCEKMNSNLEFKFSNILIIILNVRREIYSIFTI